PVRLVLAGTAGEDPESTTVLAEVRRAADHDSDILVRELPPDAQLHINAIQRAATLVLQKSVRGGFGLGAAEAMWKGKPVVRGVAESLPDATLAFVDSDAGSSDGTRDLVAAAGVPAVITTHEAPIGERMAVPFHGVPGRGRALRAVLGAAQRLRARVVLVLEA